MVFEQAVTIPESHRLHLDLQLPKTILIGAAFLRVIPVPPVTMLLSETSLTKIWDLPLV